MEFLAEYKKPSFNFKKDKIMFVCMRMWKMVCLYGKCRDFFYLDCILDFVSGGLTWFTFWHSKFINIAVPGTIDERAINTKRVLNLWERNENHTLCLKSARAVGCSVVNIGTRDLDEGRVCFACLIYNIWCLDLEKIVTTEWFCCSLILCLDWSHNS